MPKKSLLLGKANLGVVVACLITVSIVLFAGAVAYIDSRFQEASARKLLEVQQLADLLDELESSVIGAETGQRGYLLTGQPEYLDPYREATGVKAPGIGHAPAMALLDQLGTAASAYPDIAQALPGLRERVRDKLDELTHTIRLAQEQRNDQAMALVMSGVGRAHMDKIRAELKRLRSKLAEHARKIEAARVDAAAKTHISAAVISTLSILGLLAVFVAVRAVNFDLATAQSRLARLAESDLIGIALCGIAGSVRQANNEFLRIIGCSRVELEQGKVRWDLATPPEWLRIDMARIEQARKTGFVRHYEKEYLRKDGCRIPVMLGFVFTDEARTEALVFALDITEQKRTEALLRNQEEQLQQENRRKDEFIALLAHELRNPLAPIRAGVDLMKLEPAPSRSMARALEIMDRQLSHLVRLIDDLLDMSRINAGKLDLRMEGIAVIDVVNAALEASAAEIAAAGHTLELSLPDEDLHVQADAVRMTQVLNNLLNNAARYMPEGGHIHLAVRREGDMAVFEVSDQGIGIEAEMQPRVFDMFAQTEPGQALRKGGLGIGLPLARRLVQMHGGRITLRSAIGKGSSFTVSIPAQDRKREVASGPADAYLVQIQQANAVGKRILVLDDNVDAATMLGALLDAKGHLVTYAHTGSEAIALAGEFRPEIAFLDIGLPDMSGYEVARALRGMPELAQTKLVALTGWGGERDKEESRKAGIDLHLTKPARIEEMRALMPELG